MVERGAEQSYSRSDKEEEKRLEAKLTTIVDGVQNMKVHMFHLGNAAPGPIN